MLPDSITYNEKYLLQRVAEGDEAAYKVLFQSYWAKIYSIAMLFTKSPELSEDLTQDVFARIWVNRAKLANVEKFENYLFIMSRNIVLNRLRREVYTPLNESFFQTWFAEKERTPEANLESKEMMDTIELAIRKLPEQQQAAFRMSRFEGLSHQQIAERMGLSSNTVSSHISRALISLRKELGGQPGTLLLALWIILFL